MVKSDNAAKKRDILASEPDIAPPYLTFFNELAGYKFGCIHGDGKANPLGSKDHRCIDTDDLAVRSNKRASGISWIQRSIGLDDVVDKAARYRPEGTAERADYSGGHRGLEAVWIANRNDQLSHSYFLGVAQGCCQKV